MSDDVDIERVTLAPPSPAPADAERGERQQMVDVEVALRNHSGARTYHVISSLRTLDYDATTRTLLLGLSEPEPSPEMVPIHILPPSQMAIPPQETAVVTVTVPMVIKRARPSGTLGLRVETLDISGLQHVHCRVSYGETPHYPDPSASARERMRQLRSWGRVTEKILDAQIPLPSSNRG